MTDLTLHWQRLVDAGRTCPRCGDTGEQVRAAAATLATALAPLGITVRLVESTIDLTAFEEAPLASNQILVAERPVEEWLGGATGQSPCCDVCGPNECRTVTVEGTTYETVPADLITRAGLLAAAHLLARPGGTPTQREQPCCSPTPAAAPAACCAPAVASNHLGGRPLPLAAPDRCC
jgi:hypothetical protein